MVSLKMSVELELDCRKIFTLSDSNHLQGFRKVESFGYRKFDSEFELNSNFKLNSEIDEHS